MELYIVTRSSLKKFLDAMDAAIGLSNVEELSDAQRAQLKKMQSKYDGRNVAPYFEPCQHGQWQR